MGPIIEEFEQDEFNQEHLHETRIQLLRNQFKKK